MSWILSAAQRADTVQRVSASIFNMGFVKGLPISDELALKAAETFERKAYTAAEVAARTTTGDRPHSESTKAYARKLAEAVVDMIKNGGTFEADVPAATSNADELNLFGSRDFLTKEAAEAALATMLAPGSTISKIKFSSKSFGRDAANVAARAIQNVSGTLTSADISDIIAGRPEDEALDVLRIISKALNSCKIQLLNLSDNALGEKGVRACAEVLTQQPALQSLALQNVGCSIHACAAVEELVKNTQDLRQLHLYNNMTGCEGAQHIAKVLSRSPRMEDFKLASSRVGPEGGMALAKALLTGTSLVRLDISDNPMTEDVAPAVADLVRAQPNLKAFNVNDTSLGNDGSVQVALAVADSSAALEEFEMSLNEITPQGAKAVAVAIASKSATLTKVQLRENELEDKGAIIISKAIAKCKNLRTIDLSGNMIKRAGCVAVAKAAVQLPALEQLLLDENMMSEEGLDEVKAIFKSAGKADRLGSLDENMEEDDEEVDEDEDEEDDLGLSALMAKAGLV